MKPLQRLSTSAFLLIALFSTSQVFSQALNVTITDNTYNCDSGGPIENLVAVGSGGNMFYDYDYDWYDSGWNLVGTYDELWPYENGYGTYHVVITDFNNDKDTASVTLTYVAFSVEVDPVDKGGGVNASCKGNDGEVDVVITGGEPPFFVKVYGWEPIENDFYVNGQTGSIQAYHIMEFYESSSSFSIDSLPGGVIDVVVYSDSGQSCYDNNTRHMVTLDPKITVSGELYPNGFYTSCDTCADGRFDITTSGAAEPVQYMWLDVDTIFTPDILLSGGTMALPWEYKSGHMPTDESDFANSIIGYGNDGEISNLKADNWYLALVIDSFECYVYQPLKIEKPYVPSGVWAEGGNQADSSWVMGTSNAEAVRIITNDTTRLTVNSNGQVSIGTDEASGDRLLSVAGGIIAEEVDVKLQGDWPDYVFENGYDLMTLEALEAYIEKNGHLPGFPSAKEVATKGSIASGETVRILVEKAEELSLHLIELHKSTKASEQTLVEKVEALALQVRRLQNEFAAIRKQNTHMEQGMRKMRKKIKNKLGGGQGDD